MKGNLSKISRKGSKGEKGDMGDTPSIVFRLDSDGNLYYSSDGILVPEEYISSRNLLTKDEYRESIDRVISDASEHPVQNKVIKQFVDEQIEAVQAFAFDGIVDAYWSRSKMDSLKEAGVYKLRDEVLGSEYSAILVVKKGNAAVTQPDGSLKYANVFQILIEGGDVSQRFWDLDAQKWSSWRYVFKELDGKADKADVVTMEQAEKYIDEQTELIKSDLEGIQKQINEEAHFRGYLSTNAKIYALVATPNDFAYSAESGTKWIYDAEYGWQDSFTPVPDQLTPASIASPLMDGDPTAGESEEYARGDHRHPTDITRVGVAEFNTFKGDLETALDNIIAIQNSLIGGGSV